MFKIKLVSIEKESKQPKRDSTGEIIPDYDWDLLAELYALNTYHMRCINLKALITCGLGYRIVSDEGKSIDDEYRKLDEFVKAQSERTGENFIETMIKFQLDYEIYGNAFIEIARNRVGEVSEIYHIPARSVRIKVDKDKIYLVQRVNAEEAVFRPFGSSYDKDLNEFLHLKNYNPLSRYYGLPEWIGALGAIVLDRSAQEFNTRRFENNAIPDFAVIVNGGELSDESISDLQKFWRENFRGVKNAGKTLILESSDPNVKIEFKELMSSLRDASFRFLRQDNRDEIISAHGVPPRLVGVMSPGQLGGVGEAREQMRMFKELVIEPRQRRLEFLLNNFIVRQGLGVNNWRIEFEEIDITDITEDAKFYAEMVNAGIISVEEARTELGYLPRVTEKSAEKVVEALVKIRKMLDQV